MFPRKYIRAIANRVLPGLTKRYLSRPRRYRHEGIEVVVQPGVFHPGLYFSTKLLVKFLKAQDLQGKSFLELGAGSGLISIFAAKNGANVTATDINPAAVANIQANAAKNDVEFPVLKSDLFAQIPAQEFDWIVVNPPYYPGTPQNDAEYAWYAGPDHEYFDGLFGGPAGFMGPGTKFLMILSEDCAIDRIREIGELHGKEMELIEMTKVMGEQNFLFWIREN